MNKNLFVVIAAAGASTRITSKIPKPFIIINNKPMLWYSIFSFDKLDFVKGIFVVISEKDLEYSKKFEKKYLKKIYKFKSFIIGGKERSDSVYNALQYINKKNNPDFIAIHDAARPIIKQDLICKIFNEAVKYGSAAPGIQVIDTIKKINNDYFISSHLNREDLIAIQTPQIFNFNNLLKSYNIYYKKKINVTDDTEIYSNGHKNIKIVKGDLNLFKITFNRDIKTAKKILRENKKQWN